MATKTRPLPASENLFEQPLPEENRVSQALVEASPQVHETNPMAIIQAAAASGVDPDKLKPYFDLQERWEKNRAAEAFGQAITRFQSLCPVVHKAKQAKSQGNFQGYTYASYDDVMRAAQPALIECGLAVSFSTEQVDKQLKVTVRIRHGIHFEDHSLTVPVPDMRVNDTQKYGGALSYAKRYALCAALNIVTSDEDDDAASVYEPITDIQAADIQELLDDLGPTNADKAKFLAWLGVDSISRIAAADYPKAIDALQRKRKA